MMSVKTKMNDRCRWMLVVLLAVVCGSTLGCSASAEEEVATQKQDKDKKAASQAANEASQDGEESEDAKEESGVSEDTFALPEKVNKESLLKLLDNLKGVEQQASSREEFFAVLRKKLEVMLKATDLGLKLKGLTADETNTFLQARVQALVNLASMGEEKRFEESLNFLKKYESSDDEDVAATAADLSRQVKMLFPQLLTEEQLADVTKALFEQPEEVGLNRFNIGPLQNFAMELDQYGLNKQAAAFYERLAELGAKSEDERVSEYAETFKGAARRLSSEGKKLEVYGKTVTGDAFDWENYRGKVVLVDFWATWCGPCVAEIPNVKKQYEMYKDKGFDVVGVSQDDSAETVVAFLEKREIPWTNLITNTARTADGRVPLDVYYGVISIPRAILVDREGKVVSLNARGPKLEELLKELLEAPSTD